MKKVFHFVWSTDLCRFFMHHRQGNIFNCTKYGKKDVEILVNAKITSELLIKQPGFEN